MYCMRQSVRIYGNVTLNARDFLASVIAFLLGGIGVLNTLGINNQKSGVRAATMVRAGLAN